jgi:hypothetical protein
MSKSEEHVDTVLARAKESKREALNCEATYNGLDPDGKAHIRKVVLGDRTIPTPVRYCVVIMIGIVLGFAISLTVFAARVKWHKNGEIIFDGNTGKFYRVQEIREERKWVPVEEGPQT